jgi:NTP pyrophosphatase (non-canonical NTP hydrolase)
MWWEETLEDMHCHYLIKHSNIVPWSVEDTRFLTLALCGEVGELANLIKKDWRGDKVEFGKIRDELADVRIYLQLLSVALNVDLDTAIRNKLPAIRDKFSMRYHPDEIDKAAQTQKETTPRDRLDQSVKDWNERHPPSPQLEQDQNGIGGS